MIPTQNLSTVAKHSPTMSLEELLEALKELTYEHYIFRKRIEELQSVLDKDLVSATRDFLVFFDNAVAPHFKREEEIVFPVILRIRSDEEPLIAQLKDEHKMIHSLVNNIRESSVNFAEGLRILFNKMEEHGKKEEPLYQTILEEVLKKLGEK